ncbi:synaptopodin 2-like protein [Protopterus annectens]|uniref:synaptopodin 2-like protein n=1 Tax=Protopterus annectens TaxID=7888 RepID=UPI001CFC202A|nr:synaptopodin 2-like protein [Protopterus annectens]
MVAREQVLITLSGGTPWGFRLQGGSEQGRPLQVAKVRKRSKACRAGLLENDMLVSINGKTCTGLSHAGAMHLIDSSSNVLHILVTRSSTGQDTDATKFMGGVKQLQSPPPSNDITPVISRTELRVLSPPPSVTMRSKKQPQAVISQSMMNDKIHVIRQSPEPLPPCHLDSLTSPPDSEAYYAETDSDADTMALVNMTQDKPQQRRPKRRSPRSSPRLIHRESLEEVSELSSYDSAAEPEEPSAYTVGQQHGRTIFSPTSHSNGESSMVSKKEISYEEVLPSESPIPESPVSGTKSPLLQMAAEGKLIPMVGPVDFPVDETLTTTYKDKAKQAKLHRSESVQEKQVKEARTKCRTIASLLTDAPNPHSKGVLMFKKRRQRAKKYTLVSFGSVDKDRYNEEEDGSFPTTSESEFDEEGFYEARSLTDQSFSDWDSTYQGVEKQQTELESQQGLSEAAGKGAILFQQQRQKTVQSTAQHVPMQMAGSMSEVKEQFHEENTPEKCKVTGDNYPRKTSPSSAINVPTESVRSLPVTRSESVPTQCFSSETQIESVAPQAGTFNRTARPFTTRSLEKRATTAPVVFRPSFPKARTEMQVSQNQAAAPFSPDFYESSKSALSSEQQQPRQHSSPAAASLYVSPSQRQMVASSSQSRKGEKTSELKPTSEIPGSTAVTSSTSLYISLPSKSGIQSPSLQTTSGKPADHRLAMSSAQPHSHYVTSPPNEKSMSGSSPKVSQPTTNSLVSPAITITSLSHARSPSEPLISREQRIAVPASRTGILQDARRRGGKKQMFTPLEPKPKESPNPELLSMVQNLDEKPKQDHVGAGFESGPEEDFLSLGAEACNFMQFQARKSKTPPPVAPKPQLRSAFVNVVNGSPRTDSPQSGGKGAELFAKRQSRMDKFVVEGNSFQTSMPRSPSPTPSLPASWKYSSNIRAPPPIAYNPLHSPYHPQVAVRSTPTKVDSKYKKSTKTGIQAIDFMRHQPYQLNPAMFCFDGSSTPSTQTSQKQGNMPTSSSKQTGQFFSPAKQVPLKTASVHEVKRFSTPMPLSGSSSLTPAVITPRSATTLAEPVWRTEIASPPPVLTRSISAPKVQVQDIRQCKSAPDLSRVDAHDCSGLHCAPNVATVHAPRQTMTSTLMFKPRFSVSRLGTQANVWRPATVHQ